jgi:hypothetical protein
MVAQISYGISDCHPNKLFFGKTYQAKNQQNR